MLKLIDTCDEEKITTMISKGQSLSDRLKKSQLSSSKSSFILVERHNYPENPISVGDIHAYNAKLVEKLSEYAIYDSVDQEPRLVDLHNEDFLRSTYSLDVFYWERVETTTALFQRNSRGVCAHRML